MVGIPEASAIFLLNIIARNSFERIIINAITIAVSMASLIVSPPLMPRMLPQSILIAVLLIAVPGERLRKMSPSDIVRENSTPRMTSV